MAGGANIEVDVFANSRARSNYVAAATGGFNFVVLGVYISLHGGLRSHLSPPPDLVSSTAYFEENANSLCYSGLNEPRILPERDNLASTYWPAFATMHQSSQHLPGPQQRDGANSYPTGAERGRPNAATPLPRLSTAFITEYRSSIWPFTRYENTGTPGTPACRRDSRCYR